MFLFANIHMTSDLSQTILLAKMKRNNVLWSSDDLQNSLHILGAHDTTTTSSKGLTSSIPQTTQSSTSSTGTPKVTTPFGKTKAQTSVDWLDEKNLPILIGVSVTILILLIIVIVFIAMTCARRLVAGMYCRHFQLST